MGYYNCCTGLNSSKKIVLYRTESILNQAFPHAEDVTSAENNIEGRQISRSVKRFPSYGKGDSMVHL